MPDRPNKLAQFFSELKRRHVFKVLAVYAASAFIFLDVLDVFTTFLEFSGWGFGMLFI